MSIVKIDFAEKADFPSPCNDILNKRDVPNIRICAAKLGLHKKADLLEMKVNTTKDGKVYAD